MDALERKLFMARIRCKDVLSKETPSKETVREALLALQDLYFAMLEHAPATPEQKRTVTQLRYCVDCGRQFTATDHKQLVCGQPGCRHTGVKYCIVCGKEFHGVRRNQVVCSDACRKAYNHQYYVLTRQPASHTFTCKHCGKQFASFRRKRIYCSKECKIAATTHPAATHIVINVCERLKMQSMQPLPCGERRECFLPRLCSKCPDGAEMPDRHYVSRFDMFYKKVKNGAQ